MYAVKNTVGRLYSCRIAEYFMLRMCVFTYMLSHVKVIYYRCFVIYCGELEIIRCCCVSVVNY